ncbi:MAG TPA: prolipoprotein diacylglyceryl transferase [Gammaproteobacteria bacterium]|nr:prolipoprotein diacylglyceryl transferase [Gammaproteobacteria bacterium]|tara:strand:- start:4500 stop:5297 length:798 start_codon:yes stop_codon:yes gene_type:complete
MWHYPELDPVALQLGPLAIHWYAISYIVGIVLAWWTIGIRNTRYNLGWSAEAISDLIGYGVFGVILGGRIGYMLFYGTDQLIDNPLSLFKLWQGGMSFHGGLLGVMVAVFLYAKKHDRKFFPIMDLIAPSVPLALGSGRIGNFINGELPGRVSELPWAVIYPGDVIARHPSSLYQAAIEGLVLFVVLWFFAAKSRPPMAVAGMFLFAYGLLRGFTELFREPDTHIGFVAFGWITTGQLLSLPMLLCGLVILVISYRAVKQSAVKQ